MRSAAAAVAVIVLGVPLTILLLLEPASNCGSTSSPVSAPAPGTQTAGQVVRYLESQGFAVEISANPGWRPAEAIDHARVLIARLLEDPADTAA